MTSLRLIGWALLLGWVSQLQSEPLNIVVSVLPEKYFVDRIGGDTVDVEVLVPPGMSPHTYQPQARQMVFLSRAALYFRFGLPFEEVMMPKIVDHFDGAIIDLRQGLDLLPADAHHHHEEEQEHAEHREEAFDPHFWLNPQYAMEIAKKIAGEMAAQRPEYRDEYDARLGELLADLEALDLQLSDKLAPCRGRGLLVFHPAWAYFAERYGMHQIAVEREGKTPGARHIGELMRHSEEQVLPVLLVQPQFDQRLATAIAGELGIGIAIGDPLAEDYIANLEKLADSITASLH